MIINNKLLCIYIYLLYLLILSLYFLSKIKKPTNELFMFLKISLYECYYHITYLWFSDGINFYRYMM